MIPRGRHWKLYAGWVSGSPASLADRLLAVITPALTTHSGHTETAVSILVNMYLALPDRRAELAPRITALLGQSAAQPYIWGLLANLREGREYLQPDVERHADTGEEQAVGLLAAWGTASPDVQLAARRAAARLLRWETGIPRELFSSGMWNQGARLLVALLQAGEPLGSYSSRRPEGLRGREWARAARRGSRPGRGRP